MGEATVLRKSNSRLHQGSTHVRTETTRHCHSAKIAQAQWVSVNGTESFQTISVGALVFEGR